MTAKTLCSPVSKSYAVTLGGGQEERKSKKRKQEGENFIIFLKKNIYLGSGDVRIAVGRSFLRVDEYKIFAVRAHAVLGNGLPVWRQRKQHLVLEGG